MTPSNLLGPGTRAAGMLFRTAVRAVAWRAGLALCGKWLRRLCKGVVLLVAAVVLLLPRGDVLSLTPAERAAVEHRYDLIGWEVSNLPAKWLARLADLLPWSGDPAGERRAALSRYLELTVQIRLARSELESAVAVSPGAGKDTAALEQRVDSLEAEQRSLRDAAEELLEGVVSGVLVEQGLNAAGEFVWPPVDVRLDRTPHLLVTSPRDRIERLESILLKPDVPAYSKDAMESRLLDEEDLSAAVIKTGGVATYPTVIPDDADLARLLELAAHEWLHTYLFFFPLGQGVFREDDIFTLNETLASMFGREAGRLAHERLTGERLPEPPAPEPPAADGDSEGVDSPGFSFDKFMRETRLHTDDLLAQGDIEGAERYMEERRLELNSHGYSIRKINQAWFAFHGTYADSPASVSPIAGELEELRALVSGVGEMVKVMRGVSSYEEFRALLAERRGETGPGA